MSSRVANNHINTAVQNIITDDTDDTDDKVTRTINQLVHHYFTSSHQTLQHDIKSHYQSIGSSLLCCPSPSVAAV